MERGREDGGMGAVRVGHTADLGAADLVAARQLLDEVFDGDFDDADWEHCLGGLHVLLHDGAALIGHASVVQRRLLHDGRALRAGYVEGVGVHPAHRRRGHARVIMTEVERVVGAAYDLGALGASEDAVDLYAGRGWLAWRGPTAALTPRGIERTPDEDGAVFVLPARVPLDLDGELTCDWRAGDVW